MIGQGLPVPENRECIERMSAAIRAAGAVPAWIGVVDGSVTVGLSDEQLARFAEPGVATKVGSSRLSGRGGERGAGRHHRQRDGLGGGEGGDRGRPRPAGSAACTPETTRT